VTEWVPTSTAPTGPVEAGSADAQAQRQALSAPVADPLWLLARQWQSGAFRATDGGSPVRTALGVAVGPLLRAGAPVVGPVEPGVEPEVQPSATQLSTARRVRLASELLRRLADAGLAAPAVEALQTAWQHTYPFPALPAAPPAVHVAASRLPDPQRLLPLLSPTLATDPTNGKLPTLPGVTAANAAAVGTAVRGWYVWARGSFTVSTAPTLPAPAAWNGSTLRYSVAVQARPPDGSVTLASSDYDGGGLDWYVVDRSAVTPGPAPPAPAPVIVRPTPVTYPGMPRPRWWEFEDGDVNLDALRADADSARAVLATFAHTYANDWFVCPVAVDVGWAQVSSLQVTDTFGVTVDVPCIAARDGDAGPWRMWDVSRPSGPADAAAGLRLFWPVQPPALDGPVLEEVLVSRDEMANLAWLIELQTQDRHGTTVDRYQRWLQLRDASADEPAADAARYLLGTPAPDYWYPLRTDGAVGAQVLRLAGLPSGATGVPDTGVRGVLVPHSATTQLAVMTASRQGERVVRRERLVLTPQGVRTWRVRVAGPGSGDASSGLRFDVLR
jgi:hypothetical protein